MSSEAKTFKLEKSIWTEKDFEIMGWHDVTIYGLSFDKEENNWTSDLVLDIDYIFQWVKNESPEKAFTFWVAPCTLIFKDAFELQINLDTQDYLLEGLEISDITLAGITEHKNNVSTFSWVIELRQGLIKLNSTGFLQIVRQQPKLLDEQSLEKVQRGGISFSREPF